MNDTTSNRTSTPTEYRYHERDDRRKDASTNTPSEWGLPRTGRHVPSSSSGETQKVTKHFLQTDTGVPQSYRQSAELSKQEPNDNDGRHCDTNCIACPSDSPNVRRSNIVAEIYRGSLLRDVFIRLKRRVKSFFYITFIT